MEPVKLNSYQLEVLQSRVHRGLRKRIEEALEGTDIKPFDWTLIGLIVDFSAQGGARISDLARIINVRVSLVSGRVDDLANKKMIKVIDDERDGRAKRLIATRQGEKLHAKIEKTLSLKHAEYLKDIPPLQYSHYIKTIQHLAKQQ